jgi:hypothetical protein
VTAGPEDWASWHDRYDTPGSALSRRLALVQEQVRLALDSAPAGPVRVISMCAGQGRDLLGVLENHPRRSSVTGLLVELDPRNTGQARSRAAAAGLSGIDVVTGDAGRTGHYADYIPADVVLACGVFGNISLADVARTITFCTQLCATGGTVIWTRARRKSDRVPLICEWFEALGFERLWVSDPEFPLGVAAHRFTGTPAPLETDATMFTFLNEVPRGFRPQR